MSKSLLFSWQSGIYTHVHVWEIEKSEEATAAHRHPIFKLIYLLFISFVPFGFYLLSIQLIVFYMVHLFDYFEHCYNTLYCVLLCCWLVCIIVFVWLCVLIFCYCVKLNKSMELLTARKFILPSKCCDAHILHWLCKNLTISIFC